LAGDCYIFSTEPSNISFTTSSNYVRKLELEASFSHHETEMMYNNPNAGSKVLKSVLRSVNDITWTHSW